MLVRFGSPFESGYAIAVLDNDVPDRRPGAWGVLVATRRPEPRDAGRGRVRCPRRIPWLVPNPYGHSILLTTPALLVAVGAPWREWTPRVFLAAAALITVALLAYYGGAGFHTYGYRYFLDATPFLLALVALAMRRRFGALEQVLILLSVAFCSYGVVAGIVGLG